MTNISSENIDDCVMNMVVELVNLEGALPTQIFRKHYCRFLFSCFSDLFFNASFAETAKKIMSTENSKSIFILNIEETLKASSSSLLSFDKDIEGNAFINCLVEKDSSGGWYMSGDSYVCMSNNGDWIIYGEQISDIFVVGFRDLTTYEKLKDIFYSAGSRPLHELVEGGSSECSPFRYLNPDFQSQLLINYPW